MTKRKQNIRKLPRLAEDWKEVASYEKPYAMPNRGAATKVVGMATSLELPPYEDKACLHRGRIYTVSTRMAEHLCSMGFAKNLTLSKLSVAVAAIKQNQEQQAHG